MDSLNLFLLRFTIKDCVLNTPSSGAPYTSTAHYRMEIKFFGQFFFFLAFCFFPVMDIPAVLFPCLGQGDHSLEDHTRDFLDLVHLTH